MCSEALSLLCVMLSSSSPVPGWRQEQDCPAGQSRGAGMCSRATAQAGGRIQKTNRCKVGRETEIAGEAQVGLGKSGEVENWCFGECGTEPSTTLCLQIRPNSSCCQGDNILVIAEPPLFVDPRPQKGLGTLQGCFPPPLRALCCAPGILIHPQQGCRDRTSPLKFR